MARAKQAAAAALSASHTHSPAKAVVPKARDIRAVHHLATCGLIFNSGPEATLDIMLFAGTKCLINYR